MRQTKKTRPRNSFLALGLASSLALGLSTYALVNEDPAAANPAFDPYIVNGPIDPNDATPFFVPDVPIIRAEGIVELILHTASSGDRTCTGAIIDTPTGPQPRGILTAAHCVRLGAGQLQQVSTTFRDFGFPTTYQTCVDANPGCNLNDFIFVHPEYKDQVLKGYDLAVIYFDTEISPFTYRYALSQASVNDYPDIFVKFGYGCSGYGGDGVDIDDPNAFDHQLRWGVNRWDDTALGQYSVFACNQVGRNYETQLVYDFDDGTSQHNLFDFYGYTFDITTATHLTPSPGFNFGVTGETFGCQGDSGGPNFVWDANTSQWRIRAVNSYVYRMPDDWNQFTGNSDIDAAGSGHPCGYNHSFGEFGGDALVTEELIDELLNPPPKTRRKAQSPAGADPYALGTAPAAPSP